MMTILPSREAVELEILRRQYLRCPESAHAGQRAVWDDDNLDVIVCAGSQGGKTWLNPYLMLREIRRTADLANELGKSNYIYLGPTTTLMTAQAIPDLARIFEDELQLGRMVASPRPKFFFSRDGADWVGHKQPPIVHIAYASDSNNIEAMTALGAIWDETGQTDNKEESYEALMRRLSIARGHGFGRVYYTTTPYDHNWFKRRLVDRALRGESGIGYHSWPTWFNPRQDEATIRGYLTDGMPDWRWRMMYMAEWTRPAGAVYPAFTSDCIVRKPFVIPDGWRLYAGWDFGSANTACVVLAKDPDTEIYYVALEYHAAGEDPEKHIKAVYSLINTGRAVPRRINLAFGGQAGEYGHRKAWEYAGMQVRKPVLHGPGSVDAGINVVRHVIAQGKLKVFSRCSGLIREFEEYSYKMDGDDEVLDEIRDKSTYHRLDALRYVLSSIADRPQVRVLSGPHVGIARV